MNGHQRRGGKRRKKRRKKKDEKKKKKIVSRDLDTVCGRKPRGGLLAHIIDSRVAARDAPALLCPVERWQEAWFRDNSFLIACLIHTTSNYTAVPRASVLLSLPLSLRIVSREETQPARSPASLPLLLSTPDNPLFQLCLLTSSLAEVRGGLVRFSLRVACLAPSPPFLAEGRKIVYPSNLPPLTPRPSCNSVHCLYYFSLLLLLLLPSLLSSFFLVPLPPSSSTRACTKSRARTYVPNK